MYYGKNICNLSLRDFVFQLLQEPVQTHGLPLNRLLERHKDRYRSELLTPAWVLQDIPGRRSPSSLQGPLKSEVYRSRMLQIIYANDDIKVENTATPSATVVPDCSGNPHFACKVGLELGSH